MSHSTPSGELIDVRPGGRAGRGRKRLLLAIRGNEEVFRDEVNLNCERDRKGYAKATLRRAYPETEPKEYPPHVVSDLERKITDLAKVPPGGGRSVEKPSAPTPAPADTGGRIEIEVSHRNFLTNRATIAALPQVETLFQRGQLLVEVIPMPAEKRTEHGFSIARPEGPRLRTIDHHALAGVVTTVADYYRVGAGEDGPSKVYVNPPNWCMRDVAERKRWAGVPDLLGVTAYPVVAPDGGVRLRPGYDPMTGVYLHGDYSRLVVPESPTQDDARRAAKLLTEPVRDFHFASPAHKSGWVCGVLTPIARYAYRGPTPLFLFDANTRGAGKTLLAELTAQIAAGTDFARTSYPTEDAELRKVITAFMVAGDPLVLFDNVAGRFGGASLDALLTGTVWSDRILGTNQNFVGAITSVFYASGNNIEFRGDAVRRVVPVRLEHPDEHPEDNDRHTYRLPDWVVINRDRLLAAALTILKAYIRAGRPIPSGPDGNRLRRWGSYDGWSDLVRSAVVWAGLPDPSEARDLLRSEADQDTANIRRLIVALGHLFPAGQRFTARTVSESAIGPAVKAGWEDVAECLALLDIRTTKGLGYLLRKYRNRNFGGRALVYPPGEKKGETGREWVVACKNPGMETSSASSAGEREAPVVGDGAAVGDDALAPSAPPVHSATNAGTTGGCAFPTTAPAAGERDQAAGRPEPTAPPDDAEAF